MSWRKMIHESLSKKVNKIVLDPHFFTGKTRSKSPKMSNRVKIFER